MLRACSRLDFWRDCCVISQCCVVNLCCVCRPQDDSSVSSEAEAEMSEPTWLAADLGRLTELSPTRREDRMRHSPLNAHGKEEDGKEPHRSSAEGTRRTSGRALCKDGAHTPADTSRTPVDLVTLFLLGSSAERARMLEGSSGLIGLKGFILKFGSDSLFECRGFIEPEV